ncbi:hypothetical protein FRB97_003223 [Tulasnella sp. 331]|nr:hypothetical protein FRB97_003223 [Tulasnella sp. 331]
MVGEVQDHVGGLADLTRLHCVFAPRKVVNAAGATASEIKLSVVWHPLAKGTRGAATSRIGGKYPHRSQVVEGCPHYSFAPGSSQDKIADGDEDVWAGSVDTIRRHCTERSEIFGFTPPGQFDTDVEAKIALTKRSSLAHGPKEQKNLKGLVRDTLIFSVARLDYYTVSPRPTEF